ncbi:MAG: hypothetical protein AAF307_06060 [Pseudomonadota bacterium]
MLICLRYDFAFLATPKTGTTAIEAAIRPQAEVIFTRNRKHITAARYANKVAPFLEDTFGKRPPSVAMIREPVAQLRSWYRYRSRDALEGTPVSTKNITFDAFVAEVIADDPPERAQVGRQFRFLTNAKGRLMADHLFDYAQPDKLIAFLSERMGAPLEVERRNVSPDREAPLSDAALTSLKAARAEDFALYADVVAAGGHLRRKP